MQFRTFREWTEPMYREGLFLMLLNNVATGSGALGLWVFFKVRWKELAPRAASYGYLNTFTPSNFGPSHCFDTAIAYVKQGGPRVRNC